MNKYWPIIIGIIIFVFAAAALVVSQSKPAKPSIVQNETSTSTIQPTTSITLMDKVGTLTLTVVQPQNGVTVNNAQINVRGKTAANAEVFVNDKETVADANGNFSVAFTLDEGENYILVGASDAQGNFSEQELTVTYNIPE